MTDLGTVPEPAETTPPAQARPPAPGSWGFPAVATLACTLIVVALVYLPVLGFQFTNWDDQVYVLRNPDIKGLGWSNVRAILTSYISGNYQPASVLVHALAYRLFGLDPRGHHAVNLLLHVATTGLLFAFVRSWTGGSLVAAASGALFFGLHPMRVETVAWVSDLKDVLSAALLAGSLLAYTGHLRRGGARRYVTSLLLFALGMLSKGSALFFPLMLFLLDFIARRRPGAAMVAEKVPFLALSVVFAALNMAARAQYRGILGDEAMPLATAVSFQMQRFVGYYLLRVLAPFATGTLFPDSVTQAPPGSATFLAALAAALLTAAAVAISLKRTRLLAFAALFYLLGVAPVFKVSVLGFTADRFAYFPALGLSLPAGAAAAAFLSWAARRGSALRAAAAGALLCLVLAGAWATRALLPMWRDSIALWTEGMSRYPRRVGALAVYRGLAQLERGRPAEALQDANRALAEQPRLGLAWQLRGSAFRLAGNVGEAARSLDYALAFNPMLASSYNARGEVYREQGDAERAETFFRKALQLDARFPEALANLASVHAMRGDAARAAVDVARAFSLDPDSAEVLLARAALRHGRGDAAGALEDLRRAKARNPFLRELPALEARILGRPAAPAFPR